MTVHLDTSALVNTATGPRALLTSFRDAVRRGHRFTLSTPVLYEWLRGPRTEVDLDIQSRLFPVDHIVLFGHAEAACAADIYKKLPRARGREIDIQIAACAIEHGAALWTVNAPDFSDIPGLRLYEDHR